MGYIAQKPFTSSTGASSQNMMVLAPNEALSYPLPMNSWGGVAMGAFISYTATTGANEVQDLYAPYEQTFTSNIYRDVYQNFYYGFTTGGFGTSNFLFLGISGNLTDSITFAQYPTISLAYIAGFTDIPGGIELFNGTGSIDQLKQFAGFFSLNLDVFGSNKTYNLSYQLEWPAGNVSYTNIDNQTLLQSMTGNSISKVFVRSGFYTNDGTQSGSLLPLPTKSFIYWPFSTYRMRIHSLNIIQTR